MFVSGKQNQDSGQRWHTGPRIVFFGNFGLGNLGNDSTLQAILYHLRLRAPAARFECICGGPETVTDVYKIPAVPSRDYVVKPWSTRNPFIRAARKLIVGLPSELCRWLQSIKLLKGTAALIIPGTGLLTDASTLLDWGPYDMLRWSLAAKLCRTKLLFVSVGAGPFRSRLGSFFVRTALSLANFRSYRDESSLRSLQDIGFHTQNESVYPDLAFSLPDALMPPPPQATGARMVVGLGLMENARKYGVASDGFSHGAYLEVLAEFAGWLLSREYDVRLLIGSAEDEPVKQEFKSLLKSRYANYEQGRIIDEPVASLPDLLAQLVVTDFVVATRFHNVLFSLLVNKPVIAVAFHHKCSSLMSRMGLSEYCQDITSLSASQLIGRFCKLEQNASQTRQIIREKVEACRQSLDEQYETIFNHVSDARQPGLSHTVKIKQSRNSNALP